MCLAKQMQAFDNQGHAHLSPYMYWTVSTFSQMIGPPLNNQELWMSFLVSLFEVIPATPNLLGCNFYSQSLLVKSVHILVARYPLKYLLADLLNCIQ